MSSERRMSAPMALQNILAEDSQGSDAATNPIDSMEDSDSREDGCGPRGVCTSLWQPHKKRRLRWGEEDSEGSDLNADAESLRSNVHRFDNDSTAGDGGDDEYDESGRSRSTAAQQNISFSLVLDAGDSGEESADDVVCHGEVVPPLASKESTPRRTVYGLFSRREMGNSIDAHPRRVTSLQFPRVSRTLPGASATSPPPSTPPPALKSAVWKFFDLDNGRSHIAICSICQKPVKRGRAGGHLGTTAQIFHMKTHHPAKWQEATANTSASTDPSSPSSPAAGRSQQMTAASQQQCLPVPPLASQVPSMRQPTLADTLEKKAKFPTSHPVDSHSD